MHTMLTAIVAQAAAQPSEGGVSLRDLFMQSFDLFTILLVLGSIFAGTVIVRAILEIRPATIQSADSERNLRRIIKDRNINELRSFVERDRSFASHVLAAALKSPGQDVHAVREAAEMAAAEQSAKWFRKIEPLNIVGNMGPLLGLAGTVWGMVLAFSALGAAGGQASPAGLSLGISKALFHTLLGLLLAVPALSVFGFYRSMIDKHCTRALVVSGELLDELLAMVSKGGSAIPNTLPPMNASPPRPTPPAPGTSSRVA
jgi:biopolymer transport protein ExbB